MLFCLWVVACFFRKGHSKFFSRWNVLTNSVHFNCKTRFFFRTSLRDLERDTLKNKK